MTIDKESAGRGPGPGERSPIAFRLDPASGVPTYLQLVQQAEQAMRLGYLQPGDRLPTVKETVTALAINPNTVLKAYRELEHRGLAGGRPGQGTFVRGHLGQVGLPQQAELRRGLLGWLRAADQAGLDEAGIGALFGATLRDFYTGRDQPARTEPGPGGRAGVA
jgi:GntR family transcriptional regulator